MEEAANIRRFFIKGNGSVRVQGGRQRYKTDVLERGERPNA